MSGGAKAPGPGQGAGDVKAVRAQLELMGQDSTRVSAPDWTAPFSSLEDAVDRLLPYHMFGAEDPAETDAREAEGAPNGAGRLATSRHEAWQDHVMHRVNEFGAGLVMLDKRIRKAESEALQRSQLPLLMLQSYATAEAQALSAGEVQRRIKAEQDKKAAAVRAQQEEARRQQEALEAQQRQQLSMADRLQQQQAMAAAAQQKAAAQQQQLAAAAAAQQQQQRQQQMAAGVGMAPQQQIRPQMPAVAQQAAQQPPLGLQQQPHPMMQQRPMMQQQPQQPRPPGFGMPPAAGGMVPQQRPAQPPGQQQQSAKPSKADLLAAMKAKITQRK